MVKAFIVGVRCCSRDHAPINHEAAPISWVFGVFHSGSLNTDLFVIFVHCYCVQYYLVYVYRCVKKTRTADHHALKRISALVCSAVLLIIQLKYNFPAYFLVNMLGVKIPLNTIFCKKCVWPTAICCSPVI
jgi:hypothetical protein